MEFQPAAPELVSLRSVIGALRERVAAWGGRGLLAAVLVALFHRRVGVIGLRMERMLARFRAGRLWRRAVRSAAAPCPEMRPRLRQGPRVWPGQFGWLVRACAHEAAGLGAQLRFVLEQDEMVALLQAAPQARLLLLPLCRALAIESDALRPGVAAVAKPERVRTPRVRKTRVKLDLGRIPLPRGVLSAARREGFGKIWVWV